MKPLSEDNYTEAYSTQNERKPAINEIFLRTLEKQNLPVYDCSIKDVYIDKLDNKFDKHKSIYRKKSKASLCQC